jgi:hypothetical protein
MKNLSKNDAAYLMDAACQTLNGQSKEDPESVVIKLWEPFGKAGGFIRIIDINP